MSLRKNVFLGLLSAMAFLLMFFVEFPIPPFPPFLKYDPGDVPALFATLSMGPAAGIIVQLVKSVLFFLSGKTTAGIIGVAANFATGASLVIGFGLVHQALRKSAPAMRFALSSFAGAACMAVFMGILNYYIFLPLWGISQEQLMPFVIGTTIPFNLVKAVATSIIAWVVYAALMSRQGVRSFFQRDLMPAGTKH